MSTFAQPGVYDYNNTVFSPDGRLYQIEYTTELVNRGGTILGIRSSRFRVEHFVWLVVGRSNNGTGIDTFSSKGRVRIL